MRTLLALLAVVFVPLAAAAPAQRPITKSEIRTAPPEQTHRRLRDQLWDVIDMDDLRREEAPQRPLREVMLETRPRGTEIPGLCRFDRLELEFRPLSRIDRGADTPVRASGFTALSFFHFLRPPTGYGRSIADHRRLPADEPGCGGADRNLFFQAADADLATDGYYSLIALQRALREGRDVPLDCTSYRSIRVPDCRELILSFTQDDLFAIQRCDPRPDHSWCTRVQTDDQSIDVYISRGNRRDRPDEVTGATLVSVISLFHERID